MCPYINLLRDVYMNEHLCAHTNTIIEFFLSSSGSLSFHFIVFFSSLLFFANDSAVAAATAAQCSYTTSAQAILRIQLIRAVIPPSLWAYSMRFFCVFRVCSFVAACSQLQNHL